MNETFSHTLREDLLRRISINRHRQSDLIESMVGQFGGTERMHNLMREELELQQKLKQVDTVNEPNALTENS